MNKCSKCGRAHYEPVDDDGKCWWCGHRFAPLSNVHDGEKPESQDSVGGENDDGEDA